MKANDTFEVILVALRDSMRESAAQYLRPGEPIQAVIGAQTASQWLAGLTGIFVFLGLNHYRILAVTPNRIVVLDAGKTSMKTARGVVTELPRATRLGPGSGVWHRVQARHLAPPARRRSRVRRALCPSCRRPTLPER